MGRFDRNSAITWGQSPSYCIALKNDLRFTLGDLIGPATYFLLELINDKLKGNVTPCVLTDSEFNLRPYFIPDSLLAAMWFEFFQAVTGLRNFIQCEICGNLLEITQGSRSTKKVHIRCAKNRSDRKRKAAALFQEGFDIADIDKKIGEDQQMVNEWAERWSREVPSDGNTDEMK